MGVPTNEEGENGADTDRMGGRRLESHHRLYAHIGRLRKLLRPAHEQALGWKVWVPEGRSFPGDPISGAAGGTAAVEKAQESIRVLDG